MDYSDEQINTIKRMFGEGATATEIAGKIPGATRSAICGKLNRLGLKRGHNNQPRGGGSRVARANKAKASPGFNPFVVKARTKIDRTAHRILTVFDRELKEEPPVYTLNCMPRQLWELTIHSCRMPLGDPRSPAFAFCGSPEADYPNEPYCRACAQRINRRPQYLPAGILAQRAADDKRWRAEAVAVMAATTRKDDDGTQEERQAKGTEGAEEIGGRPQRRRSGDADLSAQRALRDDLGREEKGRRRIQERLQACKV